MFVWPLLAVGPYFSLSLTFSFLFVDFRSFKNSFFCWRVVGWLIAVVFKLDSGSFLPSWAFYLANNQPFFPWTWEHIVYPGPHFFFFLPFFGDHYPCYNVLFWVGLDIFTTFGLLLPFIWCLHVVHHGGHGIHGTYSRTLSWIPFCFLLNEMVLEWWLGPFFIGSVHLGSDFAGVYPFWFLCGSHHYPGGSGRSLPHSSSFLSLFLASQSLLDGGLMV